MRVEKVGVTVSRTIPGECYGGMPFSNVKPSVELVAFVDPGETVEQVRASLTAQALQLLESVANEMIGGGRIQPKPAYVPQPQQVGFPQSYPAPVQNLNHGGTWPAAPGSVLPPSEIPNGGIPGW